jgi:hypothetical protein
VILLVSYEGLVGASRVKSVLVKVQNGLGRR